MRGHITQLLAGTTVVLITLFLREAGVPCVMAGQPFVIAGSPSMSEALNALGNAFERTHPGTAVQIYLDSGLDLRRTIAGMENNPRGQYFIGTGPIHLVAPGGDELITRLEQKYYVLPGTRRPYAAEALVLIVPESLVDAPTSFESLAHRQEVRIAVADATLTTLGQKTQDLLANLGMLESVKGRLDVGNDTRSVFDHLLSGQSDVGIVFGPDAAKESQRVRVAAVADSKLARPTIHSMAMERYCPNRELCEEFLSFIQSPDAQTILARLGYVRPR